MSFWQRLVLTLVAMFVASYIAGLIWVSIFNVNLPSFAGGIAGGLAAIPVWEFLKRVSSRRKR